MDTFFKRAAGMGLDLEPFVKDKLVTVNQVNAGDLSPGEFSDLVRRAVEDQGARMMVIDSVSGYFHSVPQEQVLVTQLHELLSFSNVTEHNFVRSVRLGQPSGKRPHSRLAWRG